MHSSNIRNSLLRFRGIRRDTSAVEVVPVKKKIISKWIILKHWMRKNFEIWFKKNIQINFCKRKKNYIQKTIIPSVTILIEIHTNVQSQQLLLVQSKKKAIFVFIIRCAVQYYNPYGKVHTRTKYTLLGVTCLWNDIRHVFVQMENTSRIFVCT